MSTPASIAYVVNNGIRAIYLHFDGYPEHAGKILVNNYKTYKDVDTLVGLGDLSTLGDTIHNDTEAYARDRKEDWADVAPRFYKNVEEWMDNFDASFYYLFNSDQTWTMFNINKEEI